MSQRERKEQKKKIEEALEILKLFEMPKAQQNERSALTLLALLDLKPMAPWDAAQAPLIGITPMMSFFSEHYGKTYAPNSRENVRRSTVHQFIQAALVVPNPDMPARAVNSPKAVYQIEPLALEAIQAFGTSGWEKTLSNYLRSIDTLKAIYGQAREMSASPSLFQEVSR